MNMSNFSSKKFGVAVSLAGIFGVVGIHHFYIGNILHGLFDLFLFVFGFYFLLDGQLIGGLLIAIDIIHTVFVFYYLITEQQKDGYGKLIVMDDTKKKNK